VHPTWSVFALAFCACLSTVAQDESLPKFGTTVVIPGGMRGDIYYIPSDTARLPEFRWFKPVGSIYTNSLNVPPQSFLNGFPGVTNRFEWFAIDYHGRFWIENPGVYRFSLTSDDGSKLYIDDELAVDNDGVHPPQVRMGSVKLSGGIHRIRVSYFQGPREDVALVLQVAGPGEAWRIFSTEEFKPPPNPEMWSYPDAEHNSHLRISPVVGVPREQVSVEVSIESPPGRNPVSLRWRFVVPDQVLEWSDTGSERGRAAITSEKLLTCSRLKSYLYACSLDGSQNPIADGPIAVFHFTIRTEAPSTVSALRLEKAEAVSLDGRQSTISSAEGTVTIKSRVEGSRPDSRSP
jgi:hypothetical protein